MDTLSFLKHILPEQGYKFIAIPKQIDGKTIWAHLAAESYEQAEALVSKYDSEGYQVYFACASYEKAYVETGELNKFGKPKRKYRTQENAYAAKALWLDLDCGEGKDYPTQEEALADIERFCAEYSLPQPLLVNSGNGVHAYWVLDKAVSVSTWKKLANMFRAVVDSSGVRHDAVCTTDICRILRPVGSHNRKREPKPVVVYNTAPLPPAVNVLEFATFLKKIVDEKGLLVREDKKVVLNNELSGGMSEVYPPSSANEIAKQCAQVRTFADSKGNVSEPVWHAMIGLLKHTIEGEDACHQWSSGHPNYSEEETQEKIDGWSKGPSTCQRLSELNAAGCNGCAYKGKITSPIQLGITLASAPNDENETPEPEVTPSHDDTAEPQAQADDDEEDAEQILKDLPEEMREEFGWFNGLVSKVIGKNGLPSMAKFSEHYFWPTSYHRDGDGKYHMTWTIRERKGVFKEFELSGGAIAVGGQTLYKELGERGIVPVHRNKKHMDAYISSWFNALKRRAEEVNVYTQFGWQKDWSFVLGNKRYTPDGHVLRIRLAGDAAKNDYVAAFEPRGTVEEWVDLVDKAYNYEGQEQYQFMLGVGFGAPLLRLFENYGGLVVNGFSPERGLGKSSAGELALGIYGCPKSLVRTKQGATTKAFIAHCGVMNSLPVLLDEVTNIDPRELSDMVYSFSQGSGTIRLNRTGSLNHTGQDWSTLLISTANRSLISLVGAMKANADAEMGRILEWQFHKTSKFTKEEADDIIERAKLVYGQVGVEYIKYVVTHREEIVQLLHKCRTKIDRRVGASVQDRFVSVGVASTIVGLIVARELGFVKFDIERLLDWTVWKLRDLKETVAVSTPPIAEQFAQMLTELNKGFIVTKIEGDARSAVALVMRQPQGGTITGRIIQDTNTVYVNQTTIRKWCADNQSDYNEMFRTMVNRKVVSPEIAHYNLGKGTKEFGLAPTRCWKVDLSKIDGMDASLAEVTPLRKVNG